jgi:hypothetical protein
MAVMKGCIAVALTLALMGLAACGTDDDTTDGTRAFCAQGGALTDCPDTERSAQGACWRMVDCGAIAVASENENRFTWGRCVDLLERQTADRQRLVINCVAASTCSELRVPGSPQAPNTDEIRCFRFGGL